MDTVCSIYSIEYVWVFSCSKDNYMHFIIIRCQKQVKLSFLANTSRSIFATNFDIVEYMYDGPLKRF